MAYSLLNDPILAQVPIVGGYKVLDPCVLLSKLGEGGMGAVYRARHLNLNIDCAVKCLKAGMQSDVEFVSRFRREAELAASINATNLIRVHDVRDAFGLHYIVMEYVEGESGDGRVLRKGPLSPAEACAIALEASRGLAAAHAAGIVHRDIKPGNVLIGRSGVVKLADLGLAKSRDAEVSLVTQPTSVMGTPQYMAPEQFEGVASVTFASDVYSMGATLMYLLAGRHPIAGGSMTEIIKKVCVTGFPDPAQIRADTPPALARVIRHATLADAKKRPPTAAELVSELEACSRELGGPISLADSQAAAKTSEAASAPPPSKANLDSIRLALRSGTFDTPGTIGSDAPTIAAVSQRVQTVMAGTARIDAGETVASGGMETMPATPRSVKSPPTAPKVAPPPAPAAQSGGGMAIGIVAVVLVIGVIAGGWWMMNKRTPLTEDTSPPANSSPTDAKVGTPESAPTSHDAGPATKPSATSQHTPTTVETPTPTVTSVPATQIAEKPVNETADAPKPATAESEEDDSPDVEDRIGAFAERGDWPKAFELLRRHGRGPRGRERTAQLADRIIERLAERVAEDLWTPESERLAISRRDIEPMLENLAEHGSVHAAHVLYEANCSYDEKDQLKLSAPQEKWIGWAQAGVATNVKGAAMLLADAYLSLNRYEDALPILRRAADSGDADAMARLADFYLRFKTDITKVSPVPADSKQPPDAWGLAMARRAADLECARGEWMLATYMELEIVEKNDVERVKLLLAAAAKKGYRPAMAECSSRGIEVR